MYGKKRMLVAVLATLVVGTVIAGISNSWGLLVLGRAVQGTSGGVFPLAFSIVRDEFPPARVATSIGLLGATLGIGSGAGVVLAGIIVGGLSYHWLFWAPLAAVVVALVGAIVVVPESPPTSGGRVNWIAALLLSTGLVFMLLALTTAARSPNRALPLAFAGCVFLAGWIVRELRSPNPLVPIHILRIRGVWTANAIAFVLGVGMYSVFVLVPQLVQAPRSTGYGFGDSTIVSGLYLLPSTAMMLLVGSVIGQVEQRLGLKRSLVVGAATCALALGIFSADHSTALLICTASALLGVGFALTFAAMTTLALKSVPLNSTGLAAGLNHLTRLIGSAFGAQMAATVLDSQPLVGGLPSNSSYTLAFAIAGATLLVGVAVAVFAPAGKGMGATGPRTDAIAEADPSDQKQSAKPIAYLASVAVVFTNGIANYRSAMPAPGELADRLMALDGVVTVRVPTDGGATVYRVDIDAASPETAKAEAEIPALRVCSENGLTAWIVSVAVVPESSRSKILEAEMARHIGSKTYIEGEMRQSGFEVVNL
jgi:MFS family permease